ncbi:lipoyl(octanoyl) transferase LipB [Streptomonospora nanhaiensis]|uniref:Octanoyltransferase n=1 Tax=Streptomonospora nanhaiensis TaxID=1323731 RepID=A0A853BHV7_9ACTN|nr:lipoyl(octanoyl) transferase LipB [Streptomonospora nanhaiensis]MBV2362365.1 lipoyl(octanoyl) transferase LipB [Streptomonospora nanhaiensis]MBX9390681.1 lipoyl(octanoyl) transferase LipB [Streptomonospora nanhaiensis]NYI94979.1 lipoyl(octanoyl) transferase [Streptomonospora nanhaiensis]
MSQLVFARLGEAPVPYHEGWDLQKRVHADRVADLIPDTVLVLEHEPVYTAGKRTGPWDRPATDPGAPIVDIDRGGRLTWHGPGQVTVYPIVRLPDPIDVVAYVRMLEEAIIRTIAEFGLAGKRVEGRTGVWLDADPDRGLTERKIAAIGCRIARGVGMHGFALNCANDLSWFDRIIPCGITDAGTTSLSRELGREVPVAEVVPLVERHLAAVLGADRVRHHQGAPEPAAPAALAEA